MTKSSMMMTETFSHWKKRYCVNEHRADAAGADEAEHGRGADVQLEGIEREGHVVGQHLRQHRPAHHLGTACYRRRRWPRWARVDAVDRLGQQLGDHADVEEDEGHDAGQRADADGGHEDERVEEVGDGADDAEDAAREREREAVGRRHARREEDDGQRDRHSR